MAGTGSALAHSRIVGAQKPSVDELDRAMGFILASVADGLVGVEQARRLIRSKGVMAAAKQIRKATRDARRLTEVPKLVEPDRTRKKKRK
jgi:hypothetical protein